MYVFKKNFLYTICGVLFFIVYSLGVMRIGMYIEKQTQVQPNKVETVEERPKFTVKEYAGVICVFVNGEEAPQRTLDIDTKALRQYDRDRFKEGIPLNSLEELAQLEEDFSSL